MYAGTAGSVAPCNFETTERVAASLAQLFVYSLPQDYYGTYTQRVRAVTAADVQRVAERYIQPDKFAEAERREVAWRKRCALIATRRPPA